MKYELVSRIPESKVKKSDIEKAFDWVKDTAGELSGGYDGYRAITGVDPVTGEKLSVTDRILAGVSVIPATKAVKIGKYAFKATKGAKTAKRVSTVEEGSKGTNEIDKVLTKNGAFRDAKRRAGIPNSIQHKKPVDVYDGTTENRRVYEFEVDGKKKYIIEHREDKLGRGPHFHGADDLKGSPLEKGRYNQYPGHSPEDFAGYKKKGQPVKIGD